MGLVIVVASESKRGFIQCRQTERISHYSQKALHGYFVRSRDNNYDEMISQGQIQDFSKGALTSTSLLYNNYTYSYVI